eukprot:1430441-Karenia_brevis.AAC.1
MDVKLSKSRKQYVQFIRDLDSRGYLYWCEAPKEFVGRQRMIIDCRKTNLRFRKPNGVELCSAEGLSRMEISLDDPPAEGLVSMGVADVDNCFH